MNKLSDRRTKMAKEKEEIGDRAAEFNYKRDVASDINQLILDAGISPRLSLPEEEYVVRRQRLADDIATYIAS